VQNITEMAMIQGLTCLCSGIVRGVGGELFQDNLPAPKRTKSPRYRNDPWSSCISSGVPLNRPSGNRSKLAICCLIAGALL